MNKILLTLFMLFSFFNLLGQNRDFKSVDVKTFDEFIRKPGVVILDVRTSEEYVQGHIPGTDFNIDVLEDDFTSEAISKLPKDKPVALYCRSGNRSKTAARVLSAKGYEVVELASGFRGWAASGKGIAKSR